MKQIVLKPVKSYEVSTEDGTLLGQFTIGESWQGMTVLHGGQGIIVFDNGVQFPDFLSGLFGRDEDPKTVQVVKASPSILEILLRGKKPVMPPSLTAAEVAEFAEEGDET